MIVNPHMLDGMSSIHNSCRSAARALRARAARPLVLFKRILNPVSDDEDKRRQELILHVILVVSLIFAIVLEITVVINYFKLSNYAGWSPMILTIFSIFFILLFVISKKGFHRYSSYALIFAYAFGTVWAGWKWGASLPPVLLASVLIIVISSILINSSFGFKTAAVTIIVLIILGLHEQYSLGVPDWHMQTISITDIVTYSAIFAFVSFVAWLSNREIDRSLNRARESEKALAAERNLLELKVSERTNEILRLEKVRTVSIEHSARFGELARGLFHDLTTPLASIILYIENLTKKTGDLGEAKEMISKTMIAAEKMRSFMENIKENCGNIEQAEIVDIGKKVEMIKDLLAYKARMSNVKIILKQNAHIKIKTNAVRIRQLLLNIIDNALDACIDSKTLDLNNHMEKLVTITVERLNDQAMITVEDNGCGIPEESIEYIFSKPFTTKKGGTGIGLFTAKSIVEQELGGTIKISSKNNIGTRCQITIPITNRDDEKHRQNVKTHYR